jgi:hypothetical protein
MAGIMQLYRRACVVAAACRGGFRMWIRDVHASSRSNTSRAVGALASRSVPLVFARGLMEINKVGVCLALIIRHVAW